MNKPDSFLLDNMVIDVVRSGRRKRLSIEVGHFGVKARAPMRMRHSTIVEFVTSKQQWIEDHLAGLPELKPELKLESGAELLFNGSRFNLSVVHGSSKPVYISVDQVIVPVKQSHLELEKSVSNKLIRWYKSAAYEQLEHKVAHYAGLMDVPQQKRLSVNVRDYKRRWGSCDSKGALSFNWRIIQAPEEVLDYVVVHELAHCHEFNHSKRFWSIVSQQMPDWKERQRWLHTHGAELYRL
jgi:predicted metal-dependent hydrolase